MIFLMLQTSHLSGIRDLKYPSFSSISIFGKPQAKKKKKKTPKNEGTWDCPFEYNR